MEGPGLAAAEEAKKAALNQLYFSTLENFRFPLSLTLSQSCQIAKVDPFLFLDCARVEGVGAQSKDRKGSNFAV